MKFGRWKWVLKKKFFSTTTRQLNWLYLFVITLNSCEIIETIDCSVLMLFGATRIKSEYGFEMTPLYRNCNNVQKLCCCSVNFLWWVKKIRIRKLSIVKFWKWNQLKNVCTSLLFHAEIMNNPRWCNLKCRRGNGGDMEMSTWKWWWH